MKKIWIVLISIIIGCQNRDIIQSITKADVTLCWYRESYLTGTRAFVSFTANHKETIILSNDDITNTNIDMRGDSLIISAYKMDSVKMKKVIKTIDNYKIIFRKASYKEWVNHYHPGQKVYPIDKSDSL